MAHQPPSHEQVQEMARQQAQFMAKVWSDPAFKQRLLDNPVAVVREQGVPVPENVEIRVVENTDRVFYFVLPPEPSDEITDEQLDAIAGGNRGETSALSTVACVTIPSTLGTIKLPG